MGNLLEPSGLTAIFSWCTHFKEVYKTTSIIHKKEPIMQLPAITQASASDFTELMEVLLTCFKMHNPQHPAFEVLFPDLYRPTESDMGHNFVIRVNDKIVSNVGVFPIFLYLCGRTVEIGGIGGVCTLAEFRGQRFMQSLLDHVHQVMIERGYPFAWLAGERCRYAPWGYEVSSCSLKLNLNRRGPGFSKYQGKLPKNLWEGTIDDLDWSELWRQVQNNPFMTACGEEKLRLKYQRLNQKVAMVDGEDGAHVLFYDNGQEWVIQGYGGDPQTLGAILCTLMADGKGASVYVPSFSNPFYNVFDDLAHWHEIDSVGSFAVLDLAKTLAVFLPHFNQRIADLNLRGSVRLVMGASRTNLQQSVILNADRRELFISRDTKVSSTIPTLELSCMQVSELLFSPKSACWSYRLAPSVRWLTNLMPVPSFFPLINYV